MHGHGRSEPRSEYVETDLVDLTDVPMAGLRFCDPDLLSSSLRHVMRQLDRPRANLGGSGPPGRID